MRSEDFCGTTKLKIEKTKERFLSKNNLTASVKIKRGKGKKAATFSRDFPEENIKLNLSPEF